MPCYTATLAHNFADAHHLHHLARTVLVVGANVAAFGILWLLKFLILNRLFAQIADAEVGAEDVGRPSERRTQSLTTLAVRLRELAC